MMICQLDDAIKERNIKIILGLFLYSEPAVECTFIEYAVRYHSHPPCTKVLSADVFVIIVFTRRKFTY
jgi:hypothetical protein